MALFVLLSILNTITGWKISIKGTPLPDDWGGTLALGITCAFFWTIWSIINFVKPLRKYSRAHPWIMTLLVVLFVTGLIVGITVWDNANIKARNAARTAEATADSLDRVQESATFFEGKSIPYRLAVLNPEASSLEVWVDSQAVGTIAAFSAIELQLPWTQARLSVRQAGKELDAKTIVPDSATSKDAALLHVYNPMEKLHVWLFDYQGAYVDGQLAPPADFKPDYIESYYHDKLFDVHKAGPFYVLPGQKAPASSTYHVYRLVLMPDLMEEPSENRPFAAWIMAHTDAQADGTPMPSPDALYDTWKAEE